MKNKTLAIISDCIHVIDGAGKPATRNHIFREQMESIAAHFKATVICCPFVEGNPNDVVTAYTNNTIKFVKLKRAGGNKLKDKLRLITLIPHWIRNFQKIRMADVIYQRFPNNLNIPGFFFFHFTNKQKFATYTGTWNHYTGEPLSYRFQKWLLKHYFDGPVFIYATGSSSRHIIPSVSPSYRKTVWSYESESVLGKINDIGNIMKDPVFVTVGSLNRFKNQQYILNNFLMLHRKNYPFKLLVIGDGALREEYKNFVVENNLTSCVFVTGPKTSDELQSIYRSANFIVQASLVEGFGKVPMEGFHFGLIPILNSIGLASEITGWGKRGFLFDAQEDYDLLRILESLYLSNYPFGRMIEMGRLYVQAVNLDDWSQNIITELEDRYGA